MTAIVAKMDRTPAKAYILPGVSEIAIVKWGASMARAESNYDVKISNQ